VREFSLPFDFDSDFMPGRVTRVISDAVHYAKTIAATRVDVISFRGATLLSNGEVLIEHPQTTARRAKKLRDILIGLGVPAASLGVTSKTEPETPTGVGDDRSRRVVIAVKP
jgi:hypothetical protein